MTSTTMKGFWLHFLPSLFAGPCQLMHFLLSRIRSGELCYQRAISHSRRVLRHSLEVWTDRQWKFPALTYSYRSTSEWFDCWFILGINNGAASARLPLCLCAKPNQGYRILGGS
jgi:hypothetical protein